MCLIGIARRSLRIGTTSLSPTLASCRIEIGYGLLLQTNQKHSLKKTGRKQKQSSS